MKKPIKIIITILAAGIILLSAPAVVTLIYLRGDQFHPASRIRSVIQLSKRLVAEVAAAAVSIADPYAGRLIQPPAGPVRGEPPDLPTYSCSDSGSLQRCFDNTRPAGGLIVESFTNGALPESGFSFYYQPFGEPLLDSLHSLQPLDEVVRGAQDDYEAFQRLTFWLHLKFFEFPSLPKTDLKVFYNFNALDILYQAGRGQRFWCSEFSTTLVQCLAALGYTGRYVMLNSPNGGHVICEVWCEKYGKWIMLDPYYARLVTERGVPLNVFEIHTLLQAPERRRDVALVQGRTGPEFELEADFYFSLFENFAVRMRNDWFTNRFPRWYPLSNSVMNAVEWQDEITTDMVYYKHKTGRLEDLYWPLNRVRLSVAPAEENKLDLFLDTFTPGFSHFELQFGSENVFTTDRAFLAWKLEPGVNLLEVRAVNSRGINGLPAGLKIHLSSDQAPGNAD